MYRIEKIPSVPDRHEQVKHNDIRQGLFGLQKGFEGFKRFFAICENQWFGKLGVLGHEPFAHENGDVIVFNEAAINELVHLHLEEIR